jgi:hypothetical protein
LESKVPQSGISAELRYAVSSRGVMDYNLGEKGKILKKKYRIEYSSHAEEQLRERKIKKTMVKETLLRPQQLCQSRNDRKIAQKVYNIAGQEFLHRVVFVEHKDFIEVITTYLTTKIEKYWRQES